MLLFVLGPIAAAPSRTCCFLPGREFAADRAAAEICESPHGLADGLLRLEAAGSFVEFRASPATEPLYTVNPFAEEGLAAMFVTHPPLAERVRRLRELDPDWRDEAARRLGELGREEARSITESRRVPSGKAICDRRIPSRVNPAFSATR